MDKLYIIMPAYNEEENIEEVARQWHAALSRYGGEGSKLVIIDDGSKDGTYTKLQELKSEFADLIALTKPNSGHGDTLLYGYRYALKNGADYIFQTDSDGQTLASEFGGFWDNRERYSAQIGSRDKRQDGLSRVLVTKVLKLVLWCVFGLAITDANTPFRLINNETMRKYIGSIPEGFNLSNVMLTVLMIDGKENLRFAPITFRQRQGGVNSINLRKITKIGIRAIKDFTTIKKSLKSRKEK